MTQIQLNAANPNDLLRGTLKFLAENYGGYEDGGDFLELFDDAFDPIDERLAINGLNALMSLKLNVEGATRAIQQAENDDIFVITEDGDEDDGEDTGFDFVTPTQKDVEHIMTAPPQSSEPFFLRSGPGGYLVSAGDFGPGGNVIQALHGLNAFSTREAELAKRVGGMTDDQYAIYDVMRNLAVTVTGVDPNVEELHALADIIERELPAH